MKLTDPNITENVNTHLTHLEDLSLFKGKKGALDASRFLKTYSNNSKRTFIKKFNITTKWDGSSQLFGKDPVDGKFFIGTKGVFNKNPKIK